MLPIESYGCEVWGVDATCGAAAEALHKGFLKSLFRKAIVTHMVLVELGRFPLQIHFWPRTSCVLIIGQLLLIALDNVCLVKLAMVDGFVIDQAAIKGSWQHYLR